MAPRMATRSGTGAATTSAASTVAAEPPVVDLTTESPTVPLPRRRGAASCFIDLTIRANTSGGSVHQENDDPVVTDLEVVFESRRTPIPPVRRGRPIKRHSPVDLTATDDEDEQLPAVEIPHLPGKRARIEPQVDPDSPKCPVCLETFAELKRKSVDIMVGPCMHPLCKSCLTECMNNVKKCPQCRKSFARKSVIKKIFL